MLCCLSHLCVCALRDGIQLSPDPRITPLPAIVQPNASLTLRTPAANITVMQPTAGVGLSGWASNRTLRHSHASGILDVSTRLSLASELERAVPHLRAQSEPVLLMSSAAPGQVESPSLSAAAAMASQARWPTRTHTWPRFPPAYPTPRPRQALVTDLHMMRDTLAEVLQDQLHNHSGGAGGLGNSISEARHSSTDLLPPLELGVAVLVISMACAATISTCWILCGLPYPGRAEAARRAVEQKRGTPRGQSNPTPAEPRPAL